MVCASGEVSTRNSLLPIAFLSINLFHTWWGVRHQRAPCRRDTWRSASASHQYSPCGTHACREGIAACLPVWTPPYRWHIWKQNKKLEFRPKCTVECTGQKVVVTELQCQQPNLIVSCQAFYAPCWLEIFQFTRPSLQCSLFNLN